MSKQSRCALGPDRTRSRSGVMPEQPRPPADRTGQFLRVVRFLASDCKEPASEKIGTTGMAQQQAWPSSAARYVPPMESVGPATSTSPRSHFGSKSGRGNLVGESRNVAGTQPTACRPSAATRLRHDLPACPIRGCCTGQALTNSLRARGHIMCGPQFIRIAQPIFEPSVLLSAAPQPGNRCCSSAVTRLGRAGAPRRLNLFAPLGFAVPVRPPGRPASQPVHPRWPDTRLRPDWER